LIHLVGLGLVVRQRRAVDTGQRTRLDLVPQSQQVLAADSDLAGKFRGGDPLGDASEDQEDLDRGEVRPLPLCSCEHIEHASTSLAAVVDDWGVMMAAVDVEPLPSPTTRAGEPIGVEQVVQLPATTRLVHQVEDREVHGVGSGRCFIDERDGQKSRIGGGRKGPTTKLLP
jgi:hypothetical protein